MYRHRGRVLPVDLWPEILKRIPIATLFRFRLVCKLWNSIISSAFFIELHSTFNLSATPRNLKPYLRLTDLVNDDKHYALCRPPLDDVVFELYFPPNNAGLNSFRLVDVVRGVVCSAYYDSGALSSNPSVILLNPTIQKYVVVPRPGFILDDGRFVAVGFGYDASKDDFKIIMIVSSSSRDPKTKKETFSYRVYSARKGAWSPLLVMNTNLGSWSFVKCFSSGCFVKGTVHWIQNVWRPCYVDGVYVHDKSFLEYSVLMFDCESEEFKRMLMPERVVRVSSHPPTRVEILEYGGMLAALVVRVHYWINDCIELWAMEEHGVSSSWKKLYTIPYEGRVVVHDPSFERMTPFGPSREWNKTQKNERVTRILSVHVYDESMFLMHHPEAQSLMEEEIIM